jgi:hypothetical protein
MGLGKCRVRRGAVSDDLFWRAVGVLDILGLVPAHDNGFIQLFQAALTTREQREFVRAERTIGRGLKSFLAVGMALKEIRDKRLYRQWYKRFEEYCIMRWELSRPRAYELRATSQVVADLSAIADIRVLPQNEAQARPLSRLKLPDQRERAWNVALERAAEAGRAVTARDAENAVTHARCAHGCGSGRRWP